MNMVQRKLMCHVIGLGWVLRSGGWAESGKMRFLLTAVCRVRLICEPNSLIPHGSPSHKDGGQAETRHQAPAKDPQPCPPCVPSPPPLPPLTTPKAPVYIHSPSSQYPCSHPDTECLSQTKNALRGRRQPPLSSLSSCRFGMSI